MGEPNTEALFVLDHWGFEKPAIINKIKIGESVIIVDTNNPAELPENINDADIQGIIDHHKLVGGLETSGPIDITIRPVACTATIMFDLMGDDVSDMPDPIKGLALSCIISDTLEFRSPTTTSRDRQVAEWLAKELKIDVSNYASELFRAKSDVSDFSDSDWAEKTGEVCDLVQIPAYLCRQTSILKAAASTKKPIHLKKGQFMSPWNMKNSVRKIEAAENNQILLTDRGTFFGYNMLINDFTSYPIMARTGYPVCFDATHSTQLPGGCGETTGGERQYVEPLAKTALLWGADALFLEVHPNPATALSDKECQVPLSDFPDMFNRIYKVSFGIN